MKGVKPVITFNTTEKAAICAIKARVFLEYPPKGNDIALQFAKIARDYHSTEVEWIIIWLKAKGRVRRYYYQHQMPDSQEFEAANILSQDHKPGSLIQASKLFMEAAYTFKLDKNQEKSDEYYKISSDLTLLVLLLKILDFIYTQIEWLILKCLYKN